MTEERGAHTPGDLRHGKDLTHSALLPAGARAHFGVAGSELLTTDDARAAFRRGRRSGLGEAIAARHAAFDQVVQEARPELVLELGAGLSPRGALATGDPALRYVELDLPPALARKREALARTPQGQAVAARPNLVLAAGNVRTAPYARLLRPGALVVAEGLLALLEPQAQEALWRKLAALRARLAFDWLPAAAAPRGWREADASLAAPGDDPRSPDDVAAALRASGFRRVEVREPLPALALFVADPQA